MKLIRSILLAVTAAAALSAASAFAEDKTVTLSVPGII